MTDRLLELFKQSDRDYISGEELSGKLNISRTAVWKQIERLKQQGFQFEAIPRKGYRLLSRRRSLICLPCWPAAYGAVRQAASSSR